MLDVGGNGRYHVSFGDTGIHFFLLCSSEPSPSTLMCLHAIISREFGKLTETQLAGLKKILPTEQEAISIKVHINIKEGDATNLGTCEKYMLAMLNVEQAAQKLDCMLFMRKFPDKQREVATDLAVLACACEEVVASVHLRDLLAIILSIGNEINAGDSDTASSVKGLKVHDLLKLEKVSHSI